MNRRLALLLAASLLALPGCADVARIAGAPSFDCANPPPDRQRLEPKQLVQAFADNVVGAEAVYGKGQVLEVVGQAARVARDDDGAYIALRTGPIGKGKVHAYFPAANADAFGAVQEGQTVTVLAQLWPSKSTDGKVALQSACLVSK